MPCSRLTVTVFVAAGLLPCKILAYPLAAAQWSDWDDSTTVRPSLTSSTFSPSSHTATTSSTYLYTQTFTSTAAVTTTTTTSSSSASGNLIWIPQEGDVVVLMNDSPLPQSAIANLSAHIDNVLANAGVNSTEGSSPLSSLIHNALNSPGGASTADVNIEDVTTAELNDLFDGCFEDEYCMFFNTTTSTVLDIFRYLSAANLTSTDNVWTPLSQAIDRVPGLATLFTTSFTSGSPGIYLSFESDGIRASEPGVVRIVDAAWLDD